MSKSKFCKPHDSRARATEYRPGYCAMARKLCEIGATSADLAASFNVAVSTILKWQSSYPEFSEACKIGSDQANARIERALYERAVGTTQEVEKVVQVKGNPVIVRYRKQVLPDPNACQFWLINRHGKKWSKHPVFKDNEEDPFLVFLKRNNGNVMRPVERPGKKEE